ncbi:MAG TPA: helix-turn-helix domain-containing protein [Streptosporangiaceae bacterium]|nr:helix-turn-helix domain-containing protein [Streptosporangiaceae bacterium]
MFAIGEFARHGRVSVRMLRHYDALGLLEPVHVDPATGYRFYEAGQLSRLNRIVALKNLGFTLQQVASILDDHVTPAELRGMLKLRQAELQEQIATDAARLAQVEARLLAIEVEASEPAPVVVRQIAAARVAELTGTAAGYEPQFITPVIQPLYRQLTRRLCDASVAVTGPGVAYYEDAGDEAGAIRVHAALPVAEPPGRRAFRVIDLREIPAAATLIHHGSMDDVLPSIQALARWIDASGYQSLGHAREVTLKLADARGDWVTELQEPIAPREAA